MRTTTFCCTLAVVTIHSQSMHGWCRHKCKYIYCLVSQKARWMKEKGQFLLLPVKYVEGDLLPTGGFFASVGTLVQFWSGKDKVISLEKMSPLTFLDKNGSLMLEPKWSCIWHFGAIIADPKDMPHHLWSLEPFSMHLCRSHKILDEKKYKIITEKNGSIFKLNFRCWTKTIF